MPADAFNLSGFLATDAWRRRIARGLGAWAGDEGVALVFVAKALLASFLALWFAFRLDLDRPGWCLVSLFIVIQPESGMVLEKSFYRLVATAVGCAVSLVLVALFAQHGELFLGALAIWLGVCVTNSVRFRNFQAYAWALVAYTACIVGLPAAANPDGAFTLAVARGTEVAIGIVAAGLVSALVFPRRSGDKLLRQADALFRDFSEHARVVFTRPESAAGEELAQQRYLDSLAAQDAAMAAAAFESPEAGRRISRVRRLNRRFTAIATRLHMLRQLKARLDDRTLAATRELDAALTFPDAGPELVAERLHADRIRLAERAGATRRHLHPDTHLDFDTFVELTDAFLEGYGAYAGEYAGLRRPATGEEPEEPRPQTRVDWFLAGVTGARAMIALGVLSAFWLLSGWQDGAIAIIFCMITYALFASTTRRTEKAWQALVACLIAIPCGFVFQFVLMPEVHDFPFLFLALAPFLAFSAFLMARPRFSLIGLLFSVWFLTLAAPENNPSPDLALFLNQAFAGIAGILVAVAMYALILPEGAGWLRERERRDLRRRVVHACLGEEADPAAAFEHDTRVILGRIAANQRAGEGDREGTLRWSLAVLETGRAVVEFRNAVAGCETKPERGAADRVRVTVARAFESPSPEHRAAALEAVSGAIETFGTAMNSRVPAPASPDDAVCYLHLIRSALLDPASPLSGKEVARA